jgi:methionyl-tRNA formyltransferase
MRVVFFGSPGAALPSFAALIEAGHEVALTVTQPDRPAGRGKKLAAGPVKAFAAGRGIPIIQPERIRRDQAAFEAIRAAAADIHVVVAFGQIIPSSIIDLPPWRSINVHFSVLPKFRGAAPVQWAILRGETRTGVTIFRLNERMDEGDVLTTAETAIGPGETAGELEARLAKIGAELLQNTLDGIASIPSVPQDHTRATLAPKLAKDQGRIDWAASGIEIERQVRAFTPRPGAFTLRKGQRLIVLRGRLAEDAEAGAASPGTILSASGAGIDVACGGGSVYRIVELQPESRRAMDARAYAAGGRVEAREILG